MARPNHKAEVRKRNELAHTEVVASTLQSLNAQLSEASKELSSKRDEISKLTKESCSLSAQIDGQKNSIAELGIIILDLSNKAKSIVSLANDEARDVLSSAHGELRDIKARYSRLISDITQLEKNISELSSSESRLIESNKLLEDEARKLLLTQNDLRVKISLLQEEQRTIENDSNKAIKELDTLVASKKDELEALIQQIEHYKSVVDGPLKLLEKEELDIEQKRKDIQIYEFRIRNAYRELFPGREMRI